MPKTTPANDVDPLPEREPQHPHELSPELRSLVDWLVEQQLKQWLKTEEGKPCDE